MVCTDKVRMEVCYLNTDLVIESREDISRIVEEFGEDVIVLYHGEMRGYRHASFEIAGNSGDADMVMSYFCSLVEELPEDVRRIWDGCCSRVMDVGYDSGTSGHSFRSEIRPATIQRVAAIGANIVITIYPVRAEAGE